METTPVRLPMAPSSRLIYDPILSSASRRLASEWELPVCQTNQGDSDCDRLWMSAPVACDQEELYIRTKLKISQTMTKMEVARKLPWYFDSFLNSSHMNFRELRSPLILLNFRS